MTVNYNFDLEDDDFFADTFLSISESDLLTSTAIPTILSCDQEPNKPKYENPNYAIEPTTASPVSTIEDNKRHGKHTFCKEDLPKKQDKQLLYLSPVPDSRKNSSSVNNRFTPGFTPQTKKRKFPGPAGICSQQNKLKFLPCDLEESYTKKLEVNSEISDIPNSQLSCDDLLQPAWQHLQKDVSSCASLLSTAKHYSIRRVLNETAKKKLPKHIDVPVLCVLIKKCKLEDSSLTFIDDTGEIPGKLNKVSDEYKEYIKAGTALILKKVTFVCNVLLLQEESLASIYLEDGSVKHVYELNSILDEEVALKPISCGIPKANGSAAILEMCEAVEKSNNDVGCNASHMNSNLSKQQFLKNRNNYLDCASPSLKIPSNNSHSSETLESTTLSRHSPNGISSVKQSVSSSLISKSANKVTHSIPSQVSNSLSINERITSSMHATETDPFCDGSDMDEFDELLCNLDEKSFLEEM